MVFHLTALWGPGPGPCLEAPVWLPLPPEPVQWGATLSAASQVNALPLFKAQRPFWLEVQPLLDEDFDPGRAPTGRTGRESPTGSGVGGAKSGGLADRGLGRPRLWGPSWTSQSFPEPRANCPASKMVSARGCQHPHGATRLEAGLAGRPLSQQAREESPLRTLRPGAHTGSRWPSEVAWGRLGQTPTVAANRSPRRGVTAKCSLF